jgi:hypothetical protein
MPRKKGTFIVMDEAEKEVEETGLEEEVSEEVDQELPVGVTTESVPKRFIANIYVEREPMEKDIFAGAYVYWESTNTITWTDLNPKYSSDLESMIQSDVQVSKEGKTYLVSRWETPKEWLQSLPWANLRDRFISKDVVVLYETE